MEVGATVVLLLRHKQGRQAKVQLLWCLFTTTSPDTLDLLLHASSAQLCQGMELFASGTQMNNSQRSLVRVKLCAFRVIDSCIWWHTAAHAWGVGGWTKPMFVRKGNTTATPADVDILSREATQVVLKQPRVRTGDTTHMHSCWLFTLQTCHTGGLQLPPRGHDTNNETIEPDVPQLLCLPHTVPLPWSLRATVWVVHTTPCF